MNELTVDISDQATPAINKLASAASSKALLHIIGRTGRTVVKEHFEELGRTRHRSHVSHNFYANAAKATNFKIQGSGVLVSVNHTGIAQRYYGGTIRATNGKLKLLHIPVDRESHGKTPREFTGLYWIINKRTKKGVVLKDSKVLFALTEKVEQQADKSVLPKDSTINNAVAQTVSSYLRLKGFQ